MLIAGPSIGAETQLPVAPAERSYRIENCFSTDTDLSAPIVRGKNAVITAALKEEWEIVRKLIDAGAPVESADESGLTALMVAAQHGNIEMLRTLLERQARIDFMISRAAPRSTMRWPPETGGVGALLYAPSLTVRRCARLPAPRAGQRRQAISRRSSNASRLPEWTANTRRALEGAHHAEQVRLLETSRAAHARNGTVPLIAYAIASDDAPMFKTLLACGGDPNLAIPKTAEGVHRAD
jgi:ankyrin repeat protein